MRKILNTEFALFIYTIHNCTEFVAYSDSFVVAVYFVALAETEKDIQKKEERDAVVDDDDDDVFLCIYSSSSDMLNTSTFAYPCIYIYVNVFVYACVHIIFAALLLYFGYCFLHCCCCRRRCRSSSSCCYVLCWALSFCWLLLLLRPFFAFFHFLLVVLPDENYAMHAFA